MLARTREQRKKFTVFPPAQEHRLRSWGPQGCPRMLARGTPKTPASKNMFPANPR